MNSYGDTVYLVEATEDDLLTKQAAHVSKVIRTAALRLLPSDILEEAMEQLKSRYDLTTADLNIDLGPLGRLLSE